MDFCAATIFLVTRVPISWEQQTNSAASQKVQEECVKCGITWHFILGRASHLGGLWAAGVKSMKTHLKRSFNMARPTNRKKTAALTPGQFLVKQ